MTFLIAANDASDPILGTLATINDLPAGYIAILNYAFTGTDALGRIGDGNDLAVTLQVPEPGTIVLLSEIVLIGVAFVARRKTERQLAHGRQAYQLRRFVNPWFSAPGF